MCFKVSTLTLPKSPRRPRNWSLASISNENENCMLRPFLWNLRFNSSRKTWLPWRDVSHRAWISVTLKNSKISGQESCCINGKKSCGAASKSRMLLPSFCILSKGYSCWLKTISAILEAFIIESCPNHEIVWVNVQQRYSWRSSLLICHY